MKRKIDYDVLNNSKRNNITKTTEKSLDFFFFIIIIVFSQTILATELGVNSTNRALSQS